MHSACRPVDASQARLFDQVAVRALIDAYGYAIDHRDTELFVSLFHPDGELTIGHPNGAPSGTECYRGSAGLRESFAILGERTRTSHFVAGQFVRFDGDRAEGETLSLAAHVYERDGRSRNRLLGVRYQDRYLRAEDRWTFGSRTVVVEWQTDQPLGWA